MLILATHILEGGLGIKKRLMIVYILCLLCHFNWAVDHNYSLAVVGIGIG